MDAMSTIPAGVSPPRVRPLSNTAYVRLREELTQSLPAADRRVLAQVGVPGILAYTTVVRGERALGRLELRPAAAALAQDAMRAAGLSCVRARFDLLPGPDLVRGAQHTARQVTPDSHHDAKAVLYFAQQREFAEAADDVESRRDDALIGRLYGYPDCCLAFFARAGGPQDKTPASVPDLGPHAALLNPLMGALYGISLLMHFPCSPRCEPSRALAQGRLAWLRRHAPSADDFERRGTGLALYGPQLGIALATAFEPVGGGAFRLEEIATRSPQSEAFFGGLASPAVVRCRSSHEFEIGGLRCRDGQSFVAWYR
jgi:hypothetical protein